MSSFYSDLARDIDGDNILGDATNGVDDDLDDLLKAIGESEKKGVDNGNKVDTIAFRDVPSKPVSNNVRFDRSETRDNKASKQRKNVLDMLIDPFSNNDDAISKAKPLDDVTEKHDFINTDAKKKTNQPVPKRSVRFSENVEFENVIASNQNVLSGGRRNSTFDSDSSFLQDRPQTAPDTSANSHEFIEESIGEGRKQTTDFPASDDLGLERNTRKLIRRPASLESVTRPPLSFMTSDSLQMTAGKSMGDNFASDRFADKMNYKAFAEMEARVNRLEMERDNFKHLLDMVKKQHREEISILEKTCRTKVDLLEDSFKRRETRLQEDLNYLEQQNRERLILLEQQRDQLSTELSNRLKETRGQSSRELNDLKRTHEQEIELLKASHEEALERMKSACQLESRTLSDLQPLSETLKDLLDQLKSSLVDLTRSDQEKSRTAASRQDQIGRREETLRIIEDRLAQREEALDRERKQLTDAMVKLEIQCREHMKMVADDKWSTKQEQDRLVKLQIGLEEERKSLTEQGGRERLEIQQLVSTFLAEHRKSQSKIAEERNLLADDQQRLRSEQLNWEERRRTEELDLKKTREEVDAMKDTLSSERRRLDERINRLRVDEVKLEETRRQLDIVRCDLAREQENLVQREEYLDQRAEELSRRSESLNQADKALKEAELRYRRLQEEQSKQLSELQNRSEKINEAEKNLLIEKKELAQQFEELSRRRRKLENLGQTLCANCRIPVRESTNRLNKTKSKADTNGYRPTVTNNGHNTDNSWAAMKHLRASQEQDARYLEQEDRYLQGIRDLSLERNV